MKIWIAKTKLINKHSLSIYFQLTMRWFKKSSDSPKLLSLSPLRQTEPGNFYITEQTNIDDVNPVQQHQQESEQQPQSLQSAIARNGRFEYRESNSNTLGSSLSLANRKSRIGEYLSNSQLQLMMRWSGSWSQHYSCHKFLLSSHIAIRSPISCQIKTFPMKWNPKYTKS